MKRQSEDSCLSYVLDGGKKRKEEVITLDEEEDRNMKDNESNKRIDKKKEVLKSLGNCDVMENLASYLNNQDLGSLYETCQTLKNSIDELSLWRKRALKLAKIVGPLVRVHKKRFGCKSKESAHYRKLCYNLQEFVERQAERIKYKWDSDSRVPSSYLLEISTAASLAHHGFLRSVEWMGLRDVDLASVPAEHLASLAACVTGVVAIYNVSNTDLISILDSVKSEELVFYNQSLSTAETRALVRAMANVENYVLLGWNVTLDIGTLVTYGGRGKCKWVGFYNTAADKYREEVRSWAQRISWRVTTDDSNEITIWQ